MVEAYVLLKISREVFAIGVVDQLRKILGVEEAEMLFGDYAILKLKTEKVHEIENLVVNQISRIRGVQSNMTMLCVDDELIK